MTPAFFKVFFVCGITKTATGTEVHTSEENPLDHLNDREDRLSANSSNHIAAYTKTEKDHPSLRSVYPPGFFFPNGHTLPEVLNKIGNKVLVQVIYIE